MSRIVSSKTVKQASLNLNNLADKGRVDLNSEDINSILKDITLTFSGANSPNFVWDKESKKPYELEGVIEQIKSIFNVGKEVEDWSVKYYGPAQKNEKGKPVSDFLQIPPVEKGLGGRFVILVGTREVPTLEVAVGSTGAENQYIMMDGDCMYLKITICPVLNIVFSNRFSEKTAPRKGFREMIIKKNPFNRHVFVVDAHVSIGALASKVKSELIGITSEETVEKMFRSKASEGSSKASETESASDKVAKAAAKADTTLETLASIKLSTDESTDKTEDTKIEKE